MDNKKAFYKLNLLNNLKTPSFYIVSILFSVFLSANFFIKQQFFSGNGTTDLLLYFSAVPYISIIAVPALCYKHTFSIYDNFIPLKSIQRVTLNFSVIYTLFIIQIVLMLPAVLLVNLYGSIDVGQLFTSLVCLAFYGAAIISLCILIQTVLTSNISGFIVSAIILAIFNSAHLFAVYIQLPDFLIQLFKQLSFAWHFDSAGKGIFDTRDILWLTGACLLFLLTSSFITDLKKGKQFSKNQLLHFSATVLFSILIMLNGTRWFTRIDFSQNKTYSPSKYTKELTKKITEPVKITYYRSSTIAKLYPQIRDVSDFLTEYSSLNKNISLIIKDPDKDSKIRTLLENYGIQSQQLRTVKDTSTEYINVYSAIVIEHQGNAELIPFTMAANTLEYDLDGRIKHLITGKDRTVNIVVGNGLELSTDYSYVVPWLNSQGFICNQINISDSQFPSKLSDCSGPLFVIGDSQINIDNAIAIENYILQGKGNGLFNISPYSANLEEDWAITQNKRTNVVEMLENWGCRFLPQIAADLSCSRITMYSDDNTHTQVINYPLWLNLMQQENTSNGITLFWATPLELSGNAMPYLVTSPMAYTYDIDYSSKEKLIETNPFILETVNTSNKAKATLIAGAEITGEIKGLYNLASNKNAKLIVIPDQYFTNSLMNEYIGGEYGDYRNFDFLTATLLKLNGEEELAQLHSKASRDSSLYKITDLGTLVICKAITYLILFILIPAFLIITGVVLNVRKEK